MVLCHGNLCLFSCKELVAARKQMSILEAPNVLVIQLKVRYMLEQISVVYFGLPR